MKRIYMSRRGHLRHPLWHQPVTGDLAAEGFGEVALTFGQRRPARPALPAGRKRAVRPAGDGGCFGFVVRHSPYSHPSVVRPGVGFLAPFRTINNGPSRPPCALPAAPTPSRLQHLPHPHLVRPRPLPRGFHECVAEHVGHGDREDVPAAVGVSFDPPLSQPVGYRPFPRVGLIALLLRPDDEVLLGELQAFQCTPLAGG